MFPYTVHYRKENPHILTYEDFYNEMLAKMPTKRKHTEMMEELTDMFKSSHDIFHLNESYEKMCERYKSSLPMKYFLYKESNSVLETITVNNIDELNAFLIESKNNNYKYYITQIQLSMLMGIDPDSNWLGSNHVDRNNVDILSKDVSNILHEPYDKPKKVTIPPKKHTIVDMNAIVSDNKSELQNVMSNNIRDILK